MYAEGYEDGCEKGKEEGYDNGYKKGKEDGYEEGYAKGKEDAYQPGHDDAYVRRRGSPRERPRVSCTPVTRSSTSTSRRGS